MKKFYLKCLLFGFLLFVVCMGIVFLSAKEPMRSHIAVWTDSLDFSDENEMILYFEKAKEPDETKRILIGNSICRQLFAPLEEYNLETKILPTNAALMVTGQYLIAVEYLESHPETEEVFLVMHPLTLTRNWDMDWAYRYAVMTYVETDTFGKLEKNTIRDIKKTYGSLFTQRGVVNLLEASPVVRKLYLSYAHRSLKDSVQETPFEMADQYIRKLSELCEERDVSFYLYASPVAEYWHEEMNELTAAYQETWMYERFPEYMDELYFYPSEWSEDKSHFSGDHAKREQLNDMIRKVYGEKKLMEYINLE